MMKGIRAMALCAALAFGAVVFGATSALAFENLPHYGKCTATAVGVGTYSNSGCTKIAKTAETKKFEWEPIKTAIPFTSLKEKETGEAVLEGASGVKIHCVGQAEKKGEYGPGNEVKNV